jgi:preprotein translocase subunit SecF
VLHIFKDTNIDFMGKRNLWVGLSAIVILATCIVVPIRGIQWGIEFTGGTELQIKFGATPDLHAVRSALNAAGYPNHVVTTIGKPEENEVQIRVGLVSTQKEEDLTPKVVEALRTGEMREKLASGLTNLNVADESTFRSLLEACPDLAREDAATLASALAARRKEAALFRSMDELAGVPGMKPAALAFLRQRAFLGPFAVRSQSYIGPAIGRELMRDTLLVVLGSLGGMLVYLWIRFEFQWGLGAVVATVHDTAVTLLLFSLFRLEMSLPVVASFLTLIGYSMNDTVVVFDRIRENQRNKAFSGGSDLVALINASINQTLSRTIITSLTTWMTVLSLFFFGGEALRAFAFVLVVGIVVGTYSSIYIASPILVVWRRFFERKQRGSTAGPTKGRAKKIRTSTPA